MEYLLLKVSNSKSWWNEDNKNNLSNLVLPIHANSLSDTMFRVVILLVRYDMRLRYVKWSWKEGIPSGNVSQIADQPPWKNTRHHWVKCEAEPKHLWMSEGRWKYRTNKKSTIFEVQHCTIFVKKKVRWKDSLC